MQFSSVLFSACAGAVLYGLYRSFKKSNRISRIKNKRILITGGAGGLGEAMIKCFQEVDCEIIIWDVAEDRLNAVSDKYDVDGYIVDLTDQECVEEAIKDMLETYGSIDILVNNAGIVIGKPLLECDNKQIDDVFKVNSIAPMWITKGFLPTMLEKNDGIIVNIASCMGTFGSAGMLPYVASKHATVGFSEALRFELDDTNIDIICIMPWHIKTPMFRRLGYSWLTRMLTPPLSVKYVAQQVLNAITEKEASVMIPGKLWIISLLRILVPMKLYMIIGRLLGATTAMKKFVGRNY